DHVEIAAGGEKQPVPAVVGAVDDIAALGQALDHVGGRLLVILYDENPHRIRSRSPRSLSLCTGASRAATPAGASIHRLRPSVQARPSLTAMKIWSPPRLTSISTAGCLASRAASVKASTSLGAATLDCDTSWITSPGRRPWSAAGPSASTSTTTTPSTSLPMPYCWRFFEGSAASLAPSALEVWPSARATGFAGGGWGRGRGAF